MAVGGLSKAPGIHPVMSAFNQGNRVSFRLALPDFKGLAPSPDPLDRAYALPVNGIEARLP